MSVQKNVRFLIEHCLEQSGFLDPPLGRETWQLNRIEKLSFFLPSWRVCMCSPPRSEDMSSIPWSVTCVMQESFSLMSSARTPHCLVQALYEGHCFLTSIYEHRKIIAQGKT